MQASYSTYTSTCFGYPMLELAENAIQTPHTVASEKPCSGSSSLLFLYEPTFSETVRRIDAFSDLADNWDGDDALAPSALAIQAAKAFTILLELGGNTIYHATPGPVGEILIELREDGKVLELLFYPDRFKYVKFPTEGSPSQGPLTTEELSELLGWLYGV